MMNVQANIEVISLKNLNYLRIRKSQVVKNQKNSKDFASKMKKQAEENSGKVLFSLKFEESTSVYISSDSAETFFGIVVTDSPFESKPVKLNLNEIQLIYNEYFNNDYEYSFKIQFVFKNPVCNNHWSSFNLNNLHFDDKKLRLLDNSMGHCLDPEFKKKKDYFLVKSKICQAIKELDL